MKVDKKDFEDYLNNCGIPEADKKSNGGDIPDFCLYGSWLRRNKTTDFDIRYFAYKQEAKTW